jgi:hypothetical protein
MEQRKATSRTATPRPPQMDMSPAARCVRARSLRTALHCTGPFSFLPLPVPTKLTQLMSASPTPMHGAPAAFLRFVRGEEARRRVPFASPFAGKIKAHARTPPPAEARAPQAHKELSSSINATPA